MACVPPGSGEDGDVGQKPGAWTELLLWNVPFLFLGTVFLGWLLQGPKHLPLPAEQPVVA